MAYSLFDQMFESFNDLFETRIPGGVILPKDSIPKTDLKLTYELAGVKKEEIKISYNNNALDIKINSAYKGNRSAAHFIDSRYYSIENIDVKFENGLLEIKIPLKKQTEATEKLIEIK